MKKVIISVCGIAILFGINAHIFHHKIKKVSTKLENFIDHSVCSGQAQAIEGEMFREYAANKIAKLRQGLDAKSNEVLDYVLDAMVYTRFYKNSWWERGNISFPKDHIEHMNRWYAEFSLIKNKYNLGGYNEIVPEVFYFHHGLRFANPKVLNYIKDKDIIDCGAYIGDSVLVLREYTDAKIYCYEFSKSNINAFEKVMKLNSVASSKYVIVPVALGDELGNIHVEEENNANSGRQLKEGNGYVVKKTTIDEEAKIRNFRVGLIKADVEGDGMRIVKGAINTIKQHRPVLSLAVYHNTDELFGIKPFLENNLKNYVFEFHLQQFELGNFNEMILLCYPKELLKKE